jgi:formylglycine-generating enzyme required for sulfatase activity
MSEDPQYVYRGGSWYNTPPYVGAAATAEGYPGRAVLNIGFRLAVDTEGLRVHRGGSWYNSAGVARAAARFRVNPGNRSSYLGFRLVRNTNHEGDQHEKEE